jgi:pyruvate dehydrogenase complex dehydrogenase (E1) component
VKPHAPAVLHATNYLFGRLDERYLTELRAFGGLQSYPSRTKDPDPVDFSTGSVGISATASIWSAIAQRYVMTHETPETYQTAGLKWGTTASISTISVTTSSELTRRARLGV